jgi:hypothetical protein
MASVLLVAPDPAEAAADLGGVVPSDEQVVGADEEE